MAVDSGVSDDWQAASNRTDTAIKAGTPSAHRNLNSRFALFITAPTFHLVAQWPEDGIIMPERGGSSSLPLSLSPCPASAMPRARASTTAGTGNHLNLEVGICASETVIRPVIEKTMAARGRTKDVNRSSWVSPTTAKMAARTNPTAHRRANTRVRLVLLAKPLQRTPAATPTSRVTDDHRGAVEEGVIRGTQR